MGRFVKGCGRHQVTGAKKTGERDHQECREALCVRCFGRINLRKISKDFEKVVQSFTPSFSLENEAFPVMVCDGCRVAMSYIHKVSN